MATYTGVADANGDFTIPFSSLYTSGEKITVTAEKDAATKTIELYAPGEVTGGGVIQFTGNLTSFPNNIGGVVITGITGVIGQYAFASNSNSGSIWGKATSLTIADGVTELKSNSFDSWGLAKSLKIANTVTIIGSNAFTSWGNCESIDFSSTTLLTTIGSSAFQSWAKLKSLVIPNSVTTISDMAFFNCNTATALTIGSSVTSIGGNTFALWSLCAEIKCLCTTPPIITNSTFSGLNGSCIIKVPAASVAAYQAAANWSSFAARIQAI